MDIKNEVDENIESTNKEDILNERYYIWRKNAPFLYSGLLKQKLDWPSLYVEFLGNENSFKSKINYFTNKILLGTHTSNQDFEYIYIGEIKWPIYTVKEDVLQYENYTGYISKKKKKKMQTLPYFEIKAKLLHPGDVIRASNLPTNPFFIVSITDNGDMLLFDYSKHPSFPSDNNICYPQMILKGHKKEGTGLCWNISKIYDYEQIMLNDNEYDKNKIKKENNIEQYNEYNLINSSDILLASCSTDGTICLWNINEGIKSNNVPRSYGLSKSGKVPTSFDIKICDNVSVLNPLCIWTNKNKDIPLNDIFFHPQCKNILAVCDDEGYLHIYDIRNKNFLSNPEVSFKNTNFNYSMNTFSFDNFSEHSFVSGYSNGIISLFDIRYNKDSLIDMDYHTQSINRVRFSMNMSGMFASCSDDGTACIWDFSRNSSNYEQVSKSEDDIYNSQKKIPKQLLFVHGGHLGSVLDVSWANCNTFLVATVGMDNTLQMWHMNEQFLMD